MTLPRTLWCVSPSRPSVSRSFQNPALKCVARVRCADGGPRPALGSGPPCVQGHPKLTRSPLVPQQELSICFKCQPREAHSSPAASSAPVNHSHTRGSPPTCAAGRPTSRGTLVPMRQAAVERAAQHGSGVCISDFPGLGDVVKGTSRKGVNPDFLPHWKPGALEAAV